MTNPKAAILIIGDEILSGRTLDINTQEIALRLGEVGVIVLETRIIPDDKTTIINTIRQLHSKYDYIFTTGGIGPTHDDITADSVAAAFNKKLIVNQDIHNKLAEHYASLGETLNPAREKMAYFPEDAVLLQTNATTAPGFMLNNVFVMAGVPRIMQSMLKSAIPLLKTGAIIKTKSIDVMIGESKVAKDFATLQHKYTDIKMGSYPFVKGKLHGTSLVLRSSNYQNLETAFNELQDLINKRQNS
ncbi:MAG: competence/damage-inducible protein A [Rickettsiaceae bacterium]